MANLQDKDLHNSNYNNQVNHDDLSNSVAEQKPAYNHTAYHNGYNNGRVAERRVSNVEERVRSREGESAANGLFVGIILTALVGLGFGLFYFLNYESRTPVVVPNVIKPEASPSPTQPENRTTVIERDRIVPVPQTAPAPEVNIQVPNPVNSAPSNTDSSNDSAPPATQPQTQPSPQSSPEATTEQPQPQN